MEVTRTQYPIGQGCFRAGHVRWTDEVLGSPDDVHYVYDCGTSHGSAALQDAITVWRRGTSRIDALFVSHLDVDHVSGFDRLLGSVPVDTVYLPYLDPVAHVLDILEAPVKAPVKARFPRLSSRHGLTHCPGSGAGVLHALSWSTHHRQKDGPMSARGLSTTTI